VDLLSSVPDAQKDYVLRNADILNHRQATLL
jgi:hypothetical protein